MQQEIHPNIEYRKIFFHAQSGAVEFEVPMTQKVDEVLVMLPPSQMVNYEHTIDSICIQFQSVDHFVFTSSTGIYQEHSGWVYEYSALKEFTLLRLRTKIQLKFPNKSTILRLAGLIGNDRHPVRYFLEKTIVLKGMLQLI